MADKQSKTFIHLEQHGRLDKRRPPDLGEPDGCFCPGNHPISLQPIPIKSPRPDKFYPTWLSVTRYPVGSNLAQNSAAEYLVSFNQGQEGAHGH